MSRTSKLRRFVLTVCVSVLTALKSLSAQTTSFEQPPIDYQNAPVHDAVARLVKKIDSGEAQLEYHHQHGYLKSLLDELKVSVSSQTLVFSKTSLQTHRISPDRPRAIYFNDEVYVGYVQRGEVIEIAATDAKQGPTFYSLKQQTEQGPTIVRDKGQCIVCHASSRTQNVPGYLVRSVFPNQAGHPHFGRGTFTTTQSSPFKHRWGGWYVTGTHGEIRHMGNTIFTDDPREDDFEKGANRTTLEGLISTKSYLSQHSDLVALMVLEHQTQMHNAITYANFETRQTLHQSQTMNRLLERDMEHLSNSAKRRIASAAENVVAHLLMCEEFELSSRVKGTSGFAEEFEGSGILDSKQRSLRQLELQTRLFKYPCSYLIYSNSFAGLPDEIRQPVLVRLVEVLSGKDSSGKFNHLSDESKMAIREILVETHLEVAETQRKLESDLLNDN